VRCLTGAIAAGFLQFAIAYWNNKNLKKSNQIQVHCNLLGCKHALIQYFHSYFLLDIAARSSQPYAKILAVALIDFTPAKKDLESGNEIEANKYVNEEFSSQYHNSPDLKEALRSKESSENLQLKIGDIKERFWICIGQIKTSFEDTRIENFITEIKRAEKALGKFDKDVSITFNNIEHEIKEGLNLILIDKEIEDKYAD
jgi:hypothetical protein